MKQRKNILFIVVDCARAEKTIVDLPGATPFTRRSAVLPFVEYLRGEGTTFTNYVSLSSTTTPNFASMFSGLLPVQHGIQEHSRYSLLPDVTTLAEILHSQGYHTYAEVTGPLIPEAGLDRGFEHYRYRPRTEYLHTGFAPYLEGFMKRLVEPWFLCLHLWEAHEPYQEIPPLNTPAYGATSHDRSLSLVDHILDGVFKPLDLSKTTCVYTADHGERLRGDYDLNHLLGGEERKVLELRDRFSAAHDSSDLDAWFEFARGELGDVMARIYAHNVVGHGFHLTEDLVRVPLIIADGDRFAPTALRGDLRSQLDLFATLLDLAGAPLPVQSGLSSRSLVQPAASDMVYVEANGSGGKKFASRCYLRGARNQRYKYWRLEAEGLSHHVLWDLATDPRETRNVAAQHPKVCAQMDAFVSRSLEDRRVSLVDTTTPAADAIEARLRALGYL